MPSSYVRRARFDVRGFGVARLCAHALGASLATSLASLVAIAILPLLCLRVRRGGGGGGGAKRKKKTDAAADADAAARLTIPPALSALLGAFAVGALLGDAFLHQLPHAYASVRGDDARAGGHDHDHDHGGGSLLRAAIEQRIGLCACGGVVAFYIVERVVRALGSSCRGRRQHQHQNGPHHRRRHHHRAAARKKKDGDADGEEEREDGGGAATTTKRRTAARRRRAAGATSPSPPPPAARARRVAEEAFDDDDDDDDNLHVLLAEEKKVVGVMNLLADAAHNFTDGVVVGASFVVGGPRRGWAKTALILAHEIPQELGDFGALTHAGFTVARALFYNFLSALASVVGTAVALLIGGAAFVGREGGTEALSDGDADATRWMACADAFVAGGFAYAACGTAMAEMQRAGMGWRGEVGRVVAVVVGVATCALGHVASGCRG